MWLRHNNLVQHDCQRLVGGKAERGELGLGLPEVDGAMEEAHDEEGAYVQKYRGGVN